MRTYEQALEIAREKSNTRIASYAGGRTRRTAWVEVPSMLGNPVVTVNLYKTAIATFHREGVQVQTGGYNTSSTVEALNATLGESGAFYTEAFILHYKGTPMTEGMFIGYDGRIISHGGHATPKRKARETR